MASLFEYAEHTHTRLKDSLEAGWYSGVEMKGNGWQETIGSGRGDDVHLRRTPGARFTREHTTKATKTPDIRLYVYLPHVESLMAAFFCWMISLVYIYQSLYSVCVTVYLIISGALPLPIEHLVPSEPGVVGSDGMSSYDFLLSKPCNIDGNDCSTQTQAQHCHVFCGKSYSIIKWRDLVISEYGLVRVRVLATLLSLVSICFYHCCVYH